MAKIQTFEDLTDISVSPYNEDSNNGRPFALRERKDEEGTLEWLNNNFQDLYQESVGRFEKYKIWADYFRNVYNKGRTGFSGGDKKPKVQDNYIWELVTRKVALSATKSTTISAIPYNWDDQNDVNNAKSAELILKARAEEIDFEGLQTKADFLKFIYGTVFFIQGWSKKEGGVHPEYKRLLDYFDGNIPSSVKKKLGEDVIFRGDVVTEPVSPLFIFPEKDKDKWEEINHYDYLNWTNIHELREKYRGKADKIRENDKLMWSLSSGSPSIPDHLVAVREFYHAPTEFLPKGAYIKYTDDVILEWTDYPYSGLGKLNLVVDRDIIVDGDLWGRPSISMIEQHQRMVNNIESSIARDLGKGSAPKWVMPKNSVDFKTINNEFTIMEYRGAVKPELVQGNPVSSDAVAILDRKAKRMADLMRVTDVQRGNVPAGVTANSALRFLDEQADQATAEDDKKRKRRIVEVYRQMVSIAAQYYQEDDDRVVRMLGPNNEYLIRSMKSVDFSKVSTIQIQNTSALPDTKTGKISTIIDMNMATQTDPVFKRDEIVEMLGLALDKKFIDQATAAANTANALFQEATEGNMLPDPDPSLNLMVYYSVFTKRIQDYGYIVKVAPEIKEMINDYILGLEMLLAQKAQSNMKIANWLQTNDFYPILYAPAQPSPMGDGLTPNQIDTMQTGNMEGMNKDIEEAQKAETNV